jgi:hypothetical protein
MTNEHQIDDVERDEIELAHGAALLGLLRHLENKSGGDMMLKAFRAAEARAIKYVLSECLGIDPTPRPRRCASQAAPEVFAARPRSASATEGLVST